LKKLILLLLLFILSSETFAKNVIKKIYVDKNNNFHVIEENGRDTQLSKRGKAIRIALSQDRKTAAWATYQLDKADNEDESSASRLTVYRNRGKHDIDCLPFLREYWFWEEGEKIAVYCGGLHFAGTYFLYDSTTGLLLESFYQTDIPEEKRPAWSLPGSSYHPEDIH